MSSSAGLTSQPQRSLEDVPAPLAGTMVIDLSASVAGQYCGRLLAANGARVVLVEPPGGTATRGMAPRSPSGESYMFRHLNQGKQSISLDVADAVDAEVLAALVGRADVVIRDQGQRLPSAGAERTIEAVLGQFPPSVSMAGWKATEMIHQALAGVMNQTGRIDREPVYGVGERASYAAGTTAYISVVSALWERRRSGRGQRVDATVFEALAAIGQNVVSQYSYNGGAEDRNRYPGFLALLRCSDAWISLFAIRNWITLCRVFGHEEWLEDPRFETQADRLANWPLIVELMQEKAIDLLADDLVARLQAGRVSAERVATVDELISSAQWAARGVLTSVGSGEHRQVAMSHVFEISGARTSVRAASPDLDADRAFVLAAER